MTLSKTALRLAAVCAWLLATEPPGMAFFNANLQQTLGTQNYKGTTGSADIGGALHIKPAFSVYSSDTSSGTFSTFSARLGYDTNFWGWGLTAGLTPKTNGYANSLFGADVAFSFIPGLGAVRRISGPKDTSAPRGKGLARVDLSAGITETIHSDDLQSDSGGHLSRRTKAIHIGETDVYASAGASFLDTLLSAQITKSSYNKDLANISARSAQNVRLSGVNGVIQGFPDTSYNLRLEWSMLPLISPYISYTYTKFELSNPSSKSYVAGLSVGLEMLELDASYERYVPGGGQENLNYYSLGGGVRF